jgi:hypothetical protein
VAGGGGTVLLVLQGDAETARTLVTDLGRGHVIPVTRPLARQHVFT